MALSGSAAKEPHVGAPGDRSEIDRHRCDVVKQQKFRSGKSRDSQPSLRGKRVLPRRSTKPDDENSYRRAGDDDADGGSGQEHERAVIQQTSGAS